MSAKKTISVTNRQQLVDLNGETTNFDLTFTAVSRNREPFDVLVVDQTTLDNNPNLEFKRANGTISGNIISDKNIYQNYFLCLKADKPCEVDVMIEKKEVAPVKSPPIPAQAPMSSMSSMSSMSAPPLTPPKKPNGTNWKVIIIFVLILGGAALLFYMYMKKKDAGEEREVVASQEKMMGEALPSAPAPSANPMGNADGFSFAKKANESLIARLNNLPLK